MRGLALALLSLSASLVSSQSTGAGLNRLAKQKGKLYFGSATDNPELTDAPYVAILTNSHEFGQHTPTNSMKWDATEPEQDVFNFTGGDQILQLAQSHNAIVRGHNLVWHSQLPDWVTSTNWTKAELIDVMKNHIRNLVGHFKGQLYAWDVVNEPFNDDGTLETSGNPFAQIIGEDYIGIALDTAHEVDPHVKLYINDFNIEGVSVKATAMQNLVKSLKAKGHPIHGIGFESHFILNELPPNITENMKAFTDLGVEVAITELDIRMNLPSNATLLQQQLENYQSVIESCMAVERCVGMTLWDFTDKFSWIPGTFVGQGAACPWDENLILKPAYQGIVNGILSKQH